MVSDFVSEAFGWLESPDGSRNACSIMKPGKNRDGYYTSEDVVLQVEEAMNILNQYYPQYKHIFIYDNAPNHLKRPEGSISARQMQKSTPKPGKNRMVQITKHDAMGKSVHNPDGSIIKESIQMSNTVLPDGRVQELYFPEGHEQVGVFKGMVVLLKEHGFDLENVRKLK